MRAEIGSTAKDTRTTETGVELDLQVGWPEHAKPNFGNSKRAQGLVHVSKHVETRFGLHANAF